ncbi:MAG: hypothetical protein E6Q88_11260 [Lysobacteraceae bacterium]|nr:MAG: hypothetical protein E6Q88_11260 [Xanthomonadaceae bacterium]
MADIRQKAVATANAYDQGDISPLSEADTRRLVASTVLITSRGGDPELMGRYGHVGRYEAGAGFLADAGYIDRDRLTAAMEGFRSEWSWAKSGGMRAFLEDPVNWNNGLDLEQYRRSPQLQDRAFKINAEKDFRRAQDEGFIDADEKPARIAGFLKAAHIAGFHQAREAMIGGRVYRDQNGVSNYELIHDISRNKDGLDQRMAVDLKPERSFANPDHPEHARYQDILSRLSGASGLGESERERAAGAILVASAAADMNRVDHLVPGANGVLFAVQGALNDPAQKMIRLNVADLVAQPLERTTAQWDAINASASPGEETARQDRSRGV